MPARRNMGSNFKTSKKPSFGVSDDSTKMQSKSTKKGGDVGGTTKPPTASMKRKGKI